MDGGSERAWELRDEFDEEEERELDREIEERASGLHGSDEDRAAAVALEPDPAEAPPEAPAPGGLKGGLKKRIRARTISVRRMTKEELRLGRLLYPETDYERPETRAACASGERPCPFVSCQHHLYLDVNPNTGSIKLNFPHLEVWEMTETCALDVADRGGITLEDVGVIMNLTRERIRQVEMRGLGKLRTAEDLRQIHESFEEE